MNFELLTHLWKRQVSQYKTVHLFCLQFQPSDALTLQRFFFLIHLKINYEYLNIVKNFKNAFTRVLLRLKKEKKVTTCIKINDLVSHLSRKNCHHNFASIHSSS